MKAVKRFLGLLKENLKSKLWMIVAVWYVFSMFCLLFSTKMTIPTGEVRSLYVGAGNTSFCRYAFLRRIDGGWKLPLFIFSAKS